MNAVSSPANGGGLAPEAISVEDAAKISGLGRTTVYAAISTGALPSVKFGKRRLVRVAALRAWLQQLERGAAV